MVDKRIALDDDVLSNIMTFIKRASDIEIEDAVHDREKLGLAVTQLYYAYEHTINTRVEINDISGRRLGSLINNGIYKDEAAALADAISMLFDSKREEIMSKIASL